METASIDCPNCRQSAVREPQSEGSNSLAVSAPPQGLSDLQDRVRSLDALISRLNQERASALRKINSIRDKTRNLPPEILSHIFQFVCPPIDFHNHVSTMHDLDRKVRCQHFRRDTYHREEDYHFGLATVSHRWRQIVQSTPHLWTTLSIGVWQAFNESHTSLLNLYSRCAGTLGVSMELDFRYHLVQWLKSGTRQKRIESLTLLKPIFEAFIRLAPRIQHLSLISPPSEILFNISKNFALCSSLIIRDADPLLWLEEPSAVVVDLPHLQRLSLHRIDSPFVLPWGSITTLELDCMPRCVSFDALTRCLNLVKFGARRTCPSSYSHTPHHELIVHENLELMSCEDDVDLYHRFRFTKLRVLHWNNIFIDPTNCHLHKVIFANLPTTLVSLTLGQVRLAEDVEYALQDLLICVPQLVELRLFQCDYEESVLVIESIGRQAQPSYTQESAALGPKILPNLRKLLLHSTEILNSDIILDMLEAMSTVRTNEEGFYMELYDIFWEEEDSQRLQELASREFNFQIITEIEVPESMDFPW